MDIEVYTFEDSDGAVDSFTTMNPIEAKEYASEHSRKWIANQYEFADSELVEDYTD